MDADFAPLEWVSEARIIRNNSMPRKSNKQAILSRLEEIRSIAMKHAMLLEIIGVEYAKPLEVLYQCSDIISRVRNRRYFARPKYRSKIEKFNIYLDPDHPDGLNDREFKFHFRMSRECFAGLVELVEDHVSFKKRTNDPRGRRPRPAAHQLLVLMKYLGCEGNAASSISLGTFFGIGSGSVDKCREAALEALLSLESQTYFWPDAEERRAISSRIQREYLWPNCVGLMDGTLLPLTTRPLLHGENYLSRKRFYAIVMLVVCDDIGRILYYHVGWPGSVHDNRVWRNSSLCRKWRKYFSNKEYLLGDSAFTASDIVIPPFKSLPGSELQHNAVEFNTLLSKPRVKSEHCIGIFKGRMPFLKGIRLMLANAIHMRRIIKYVRGCVVLHNFLIRESAEWLDNEVGGDIDDDLEPERPTRSNQANYTRRDELLYYLSELQETNIN